MVLFGLKKVVKLFDDGNVSVSGLRGRGKDLLTSNVVARRGLPYVSNCDYGFNYVPFDIERYDIKNTYTNFIYNRFKYYKFPYEDKTDIYLSDCGIYFPSQYFKDLDNKFGFFSVFMALSRHLGNCNVHTNSQALNRVWDKIREQSDTYIVCRSCKVFFGKLVIQNIRVYEKYDSAVANVPPLRFNSGLLTSQVNKTNIELAKRNYFISYGDIKCYTLIYFNKSMYNTRFFKDKFLNGEKNNEKK